MNVHPSLKRFQKGSTLTLPAGEFDLGKADVAHIRCEHNNAKISGAGVGKTILHYEALEHSTEHWNRGNCIFLGSPVTTIYHTKAVIENLTIVDHAPHTDFGSGPSGVICAYYYNDLHVRNVELVNSHGNGSLTIVHNTHGPVEFGKAGVEGKKVRLSNLWIHGDWIQGDGINIGNYTDVIVENCCCEGNIRRHAFEGGWLENTNLIGNYFAAGPDGHNGCGTMGLKDSRVIGNVIKSQRTGTPAFGFDSDAAHIPAGYNVLVSGNQLFSPHEALRIQASTGGPQKDIRIHNNLLSAPYGVSIYYRVPNGTTDIYHNTFDFQGTYGEALTGAISGAPGAVFQEDSVVRLRQNEYRNGMAGHTPEYQVVNTDEYHWSKADGRIAA